MIAGTNVQLPHTIEELVIARIFDAKRYRKGWVLTQQAQQAPQGAVFKAKGIVAKLNFSEISREVATRVAKDAIRLAKDYDAFIMVTAHPDTEDELIAGIEKDRVLVAIMEQVR